MDASGYTITGVLSQIQKGKWHLIAFFSRKLSPAEQNYGTLDQKLLAIVHSFKHWRHYLEGAQYKITVLTDATNLKGFNTTVNLTRRNAR